MSFQPLDPDFENKIKESFSRQGFMDFIGAEITDIRPGYCEIQVSYKRELSQQHGFFHAGIIGTLADNSGGYAAFPSSAFSANTYLHFRVILVRFCYFFKLYSASIVLKAPSRS